MWQKSQSYDVPFLRHGVRQTEFFKILGHFLPFYRPPPPPHPTNDSKKSNFWTKMIKMSRDLILLYIHYAINGHHMIHGSWNVRCDWQKFLSFWVIFYSFSPLTTRKIKILKLKKAPGDIIILYICTINNNHTMYDSWDMEILKKWKNLLEISFFNNSAPKIMIICCTVS